MTNLTLTCEVRHSGIVHLFEMDGDRKAMYDGWRKDEAHSKEWQAVTKAFLDHAFAVLVVLCPCSKRENKWLWAKEDIEEHLCIRGFMPNYLVWRAHGERGERVDQGVDLHEDHDMMDEMLNDLGMGVDRTAEGPGQLPPEVEEFWRFLDASDESSIGTRRELATLLPSSNVSAAGVDRVGATTPGLATTSRVDDGTIGLLATSRVDDGTAGLPDTSGVDGTAGLSTSFGVDSTAELSATSQLATSGMDDTPRLPTTFGGSASRPRGPTPDAKGNDDLTGSGGASGHNYQSPQEYYSMLHFNLDLSKSSNLAKISYEKVV
ncbi:hypothetical protein U9M48_014342 [Paspalum notatum var. saurae]|uniref:Transposase-associated domain-containing protein n=1 Tax=Paspalum notatum var. saurae TaxID=547442 RepID=A0AAQ3T1D9_PASNO